jgi:cupin superfamily acireductone dioxygenase involved in methionine salvage
MTQQEKNNTKTFSLRLETWLYEKLIAVSGTKGKNEYIRNLLIFDLNEQEKNNERTTDEKPSSEIIKELEMKDRIIQVLEGRVKDLQNQNGFLIQDHNRISGQLDRLLMPSQEEQKQKYKKWFEFWK